MRFIPPHITDEITTRASERIVEIAKWYVKDLKKKGANWVGLSPFKQEKTPSFTVHEGKGIFKCFATQIGGPAVKLVQEMERMEWLEAMHHLADRLGIEIPQEQMTDHQRAQIQRSDRVRHICEDAQQIFQANLKHADLDEYLMSRGLNQKEALTQGLGYATDGWTGLIEALRKKGYADAELKDAGIASTTKDQRLIDFYRERLIIPIKDQRGKLIGFGGRYLGDGEAPKYLNPRQTPIYDKGAVLFGFDQARDEIAKQDFAIITEGYFDVLTPMRKGVRNVVATCGTALTEAHAKLIKRYTHNVLILRDGDDAGQRATLKDIKVLLSAGLWPRVLTLPDEQDPDDFFLTNGLDKWREALEGAMVWYDWQAAYLAQTYDNSTAKGRERILEGIIENIRVINSIILREETAADVAKALKVREKLVLGMLEEAPLRLERRMSWDSYKVLSRKLNMESPYVGLAEDGGVEFQYRSRGALNAPLQATVQGEKVDIRRSTRSYEAPFAPYIPQMLLIDAGADLVNLDLQIFLTHDEITADVLTWQGVHTLGLGRPDGFRNTPNSSRPNKWLKKMATRDGVKIIYILPGEAFHLPLKGKSGSEPYAEKNAAEIAYHWTDVLTNLIGIFPKQRIWVVYPDHRRHDVFPTRHPRWVEHLALAGKGHMLAEEIERAIEPYDNDAGLLEAREISNMTRAQILRIFRADQAQTFYDFHKAQIGGKFRFGREIWEADTKGQVIKLGEEMPEPDVYGRAGRYWAKGKDGHKDISNFEMECQLRIMGRGAFGIYKVQNVNGQNRTVILENNLFRDASKFADRMSEIPRLNAFYKGSSPNLAELQQQICEGSEEATNLGMAMGWYQRAGELDEAQSEDGFWVFGNGVLNGRFWQTNPQGLVQLSGETYYIPALSSIQIDPEKHAKRYERQREFLYQVGALSWEGFTEQIMRVYGDNGHIGLCYSVMAMYYDIVMKEMKQAPLMHLVGPPGAGKDVFLESLKRIWAEEIKWMDLQTSKITPAGYAGFFQQYHNCLSIVNEFNPSSVEERYLHPIKATYQGKLGEKMAGPNTTEMSSGKVTSAVVILGQEQIYTMKAINHRCIVVEMEKKARTDEDREAYNKLKREEKQGMGQVFIQLAVHRELIAEQLRPNFELIQNRISAMIPDQGPDTERLIYNWSVMYAPLWTLVAGGIMDYPMSAAKMLSLAAERIKQHDDAMRTYGLLDIFFQEFVSPYYMGRQYDLHHQHIFHQVDCREVNWRNRKGESLTRDVKEGIITLQLNNIYPRFAQYLRSKSVKIENTSKADLKRELRAHPAFICTKKTEWIGWQMDAQGRPMVGSYETEQGESRAKFKKYRTSAMLFDAAQLDIDIRRDWGGEATETATETDQPAF